MAPLALFLPLQGVARPIMISLKPSHFLLILYLALARLVGLRRCRAQGPLSWNTRSGEGFYDRFGSCEKPHDKEMSGVGRSDWSDSECVLLQCRVFCCDGQLSQLQ
ncbi:hypothetical protein DER44DRAFT_785163 [Fusarium oxysporum]|nr:hypothetical protein DER44DRAFT_785163 [Fusarium oxysporum]